MTIEVKCLEYAWECSRRAKLVTNPELRKRLLNIARGWTERATREPFTSDAKTHEQAGEAPARASASAQTISRHAGEGAASRKSAS